MAYIIRLGTFAPASCNNSLTNENDSPPQRIVMLSPNSSGHVKVLWHFLLKASENTEDLVCNVCNVDGAHPNLWTGIQRSFASKIANFCLQYGGHPPIDADLKRGFPPLMLEEVLEHKTSSKSLHRSPQNANVEHLAQCSTSSCLSCQRYLYALCCRLCSASAGCSAFRSLPVGTCPANVNSHGNTEDLFTA